MPSPVLKSGEDAQDYLNNAVEAGGLAQASVPPTAAPRPTRERQYDAALDRLNDTYAERSVEGEDAERWAALAKGFATPTYSFWESLANAGAAKGQVVAAQEAQHMKNQREAAKTNYDHESALLKAQEMGLSRASAGGTKSRPIKLQDGSWATWTPDGVLPIPGSQQAALDAAYQKQYELGSKILDTNDPQALHDFAMGKVGLMVNANAGVATSPQQPPQAAGAKPLVPGIAPQPLPEQPVTGTEQTTTDTEAVDPKVLLQQVIQARDALPLSDPKRAEHNNIITEIRKSMAGQPAAPKVTLKTKETEGEQEGRGKERGKKFEEIYHDIQKTGQASTSLDAQLATLEALYTKHGDNIPSGALAPIVTSVKSGLETFGVKFDGTGPTDVIRSIGTLGALQGKRADGENLMPGALVTFEEKLLMDAFPGMSMTKEGRLMQIQIMRSLNRLKQDVAGEARKYYKEHGKLDTGWYDKAEEMALSNPLLDPKRLEAMEIYAKRQAARK